MMILMRVLALLGTGSALGAILFAWSVLGGPTQCAITGASMTNAGGSAPSANRDLVVSFYTEALLEHHVARAANFLRPDYIQHNPRVGQGLDGFVAYFTGLNERLAAQGATSRGEITLVMAEGDLVTLHVTTVIDGPVTASFRSVDTFRVADGKIAEHWDTIQPCDLRSALLMAISG